jgi:hypothetical protein
LLQADRSIRKKNGTSYKLSALKSIRFGLSIHFSRELEIDIIHDPLFKRANEVFHAVTVDMKRKGLAKVDHTPPIEPEDLKQMYGSDAGARNPQITSRHSNHRNGSQNNNICQSCTIFYNFHKNKTGNA